MARIFTTGAEEYDLVSLWDVMDNSPENSAMNASIIGDTEIITATPRTGKGMYGLHSTTFLRKSFGVSTSVTELYWGFAVRLPYVGVNQVPFFQVFTDNPSTYNNYDGLMVTSGGAVQALRGGTIIATSSAGIISANTWYYFEVWLKPLNSNGRFVVKVDGAAACIDYTGDTTDNKEYINAWGIQGVEGNTGRTPTLFDDIVVNDTSGSDNNTYPGLVRLLPIRPESAGSNADWSRAGVDLGADEAQARNGGFEFAMLQTADADDKVTLSTEIPDLPVGATITNVIVSARARVQSGAGVIAPMINSNGTESISADQNLASGWRYYSYVWHHNPEDNADWAEADIDTIDIGVSS